MGLAERLEDYHRFVGLRSIAHGLTLELEWPSHADYPSYGYVVTRRNLDEMVADQAVKAGATFWPATEALEPLLENGLVVGAMVKRKEQRHHARPSGPATSWSPTAPTRGSAGRWARPGAAATRWGWPSGATTGPPATTSRGSRATSTCATAEGDALPGYGWIFPVGDGTVNVGVGLLSTFKGWKSVNTSHLMDAFVAMAPPAWEIRPDTAVGPPTGGRLPMGGSVHPSAGPDLAGGGRRLRGHQPLQRRGHRLRLRDRADGRRGARRGARGRATASPCARYPERLEEVYGLYFRVARTVRAGHRQPGGDGAS